ncbi:MAG: peptidoglycan editing factor PgeF [Hyphomonadaceae bacterium]|nr:peptidoglycan editing factor PgeF [Hyphomonadaceae bacterium]
MSIESRSAGLSRILNAELLAPLRAQGLAGAPHGFFGRKGGVSAGIYSSLNAGPGSDDAPDNVAENRRRIAANLGVDCLLSLYQIHSPNVVRVHGPFAGERPQGDAMVTTTPGLALGVLTADCAPILFADREAGVIGAAHAGWRGALSGVLEATVAAMREAGARRIAAAIGPTIAQASYEIGPEFEERFLREDPSSAPFFTGTGKRRFDLPGFCAARLAAAGIEDVDVLAFDTYALADDWFSNRRAVHAGEKGYGRNCAAIALPSK